MKIVNLTPHAITVMGCDPIPPSGDVARVSSTETQTGKLNGMPEGIQETGKVTGLPPHSDCYCEACAHYQGYCGMCEGGYWGGGGLLAGEPGTIYIVSTMVRLACPDRDDLRSPGQLVRDNDGKPIGCQMLIRNGGV